MSKERRINIAIHETPHTLATVAAALDGKKKLVKFIDEAATEKAERLGVTRATIDKMRLRPGKLKAA